MTSTSLTLPDLFAERPNGPFPTWEEFAARPDARDAALAIGRLHGEMIDKISALADANGGGLHGVARGALNLRVQQGLLTSSDRDRMLAAVEYLLGIDNESDVGSVVAQVQEIHRQVANDPASTLPALMASSIMIDSVSRAAKTHSDTFVSGVTTALADVVTSFVALGTGPIMSGLITYTVSSLTMLAT
jgi:hypothetical protein